MTRTVQHDDANQVNPDSDTVEARALSIVGVDPELGFGGGETQVLGLTLALAAGGHRAELICDPAGRLWEQATAAGVKCHPIRIRNAIDLAAGLKLRAILKRERYDVVHFHTSRAHSMAPFARGFGSTLVVTRRMDYRPNRVFAPYLYNRAVDGVIAISAGVPIRWRPRASIASASPLCTAAWIATASARQLLRNASMHAPRSEYPTATLWYRRLALSNSARAISISSKRSERSRQQGIPSR